MDGPEVKALAHRLSVAVWGHRIDRVDVPIDRWQANVLLKHCAGHRVLRIYSHGCWLIWNFEHGVSWLVYPVRRWSWEIVEADGDFSRERRAVDAGITGVATRWRSRALIRSRLDDGREIVLSGRPLFLTLLTAELWRHPHLSDIGPDPLGEALSATDWRFRLRLFEKPTIARALLDQRVVAGIGNPWKCEILYAAGLHPSMRASGMHGEQIQRLAAAAQTCLTRAYRHYLGDATEGPLCAVYDRAGEPCPACGAAIAVDRSGRDGQWTWYCPKCQQVDGEALLFENW